MNTKLGFIGGGNMTASMIKGLAMSQNGADLIDPKDVWIFDRNATKMRALSGLYGVQCAENAVQLVELCRVVVLAVKPQGLNAALKPLTKNLNRHQPLLISVAAGVLSTTIERWLGNDFALIRAMPNTPSSIGLGACGLYANSRVSDEQKILAESLFNRIGISQWLDNEHSIDLVTALSGSGPAYCMLFIQSMIDASVDAGLDSRTAKTLALQTVIGAAELVKRSDQPINQLIKNISSPNGTTEKALEALNGAGLPGIVAEAVNAARLRAEQLAGEFDLARTQHTG